MNPITHIPTTPEMRDFNEAVYVFDSITNYAMDTLTDLKAMADIADKEGFVWSARIIREAIK